AAAMRKIDPHYAPVDYYLALARIWKEQPDQAIPLFKAALAKQGDAGKRQGYVSGFLQAMAAAGHAVDAYAAAPEAREAFHLLAGELKQGYRRDDMRTLVARHAAKDPGDPLLPLYQGE